MALFNNEAKILSFFPTLLLLLLNAYAALVHSPRSQIQEDQAISPHAVSLVSHESIVDADQLVAIVLHSFRLCNLFTLFDEDLGYWVKSRSTTWFSWLLVSQYGKEMWIQMFQMTKPVVFAQSELLKPQVQKQDTKYRLAILVLVHVAVTLFKLTHGGSCLFVCGEMFVVGKSTCSVIL